MQSEVLGLRSYQNQNFNCAQSSLQLYKPCTILADKEPEETLCWSCASGSPARMFNVLGSLCEGGRICMGLQVSQQNICRCFLPQTRWKNKKLGTKHVADQDNNWHRPRHYPETASSPEWFICQQGKGSETKLYP